MPLDANNAMPQAWRFLWVEMMNSVWQVFLAWQAEYQPSEYLLACSGGMDSMALLHQVYVMKADLTAPVRVIYINHGWHPQAAAWGNVVQAAAQDYGFCFQNIALNLSKQGNAEALARTARYAAFAEQLAPRGVLLTAHHQNDQAETLLLNLLRGSGIEGLSAMPKRRNFAQGEHWRPLLDISRADIESYAAFHRLQAVHDDSNDDVHYARNWLRHEVLPLLTTRYPQAVAALAQSAEHLAASRAVQESYFDAQLPAQQEYLDWQLCATKSAAEQMLWLRHWLALQGLPKPPRERLQEFVRQIRSGSTYAEMQYADILLYYYQSAVAYLENQVPSSPPPFALSTVWAGVGELAVEKGAHLLQGKSCCWTLYPPAGSFRPADKAHTKPLKEWLRLAKIPPILRRRLPLLWVDGQLAWVGGLGAAASFAELRLLWHKKPKSDKIAR